MNPGFNEFKESILDAKRLIESNRRTEGSALYDIRIWGFPIILISIIAMLVITLPACAKADLNQSANLGADPTINPAAYLSGFDEGYKLGVLVILAQSNSTIAEEYNVLVQQHNDLLNKTLGLKDAEPQLLAKVSIAAKASPKKPYDPWEL